MFMGQQGEQCSWKGMNKDVCRRRGQDFGFYSELDVASLDGFEYSLKGSSCGCTVKRYCNSMSRTREIRQDSRAEISNLTCATLNFKIFSPKSPLPYVNNRLHPEAKATHLGITLVSSFSITFFSLNPLTSPVPYPVNSPSPSHYP